MFSAQGSMQDRNQRLKWLMSWCLRVVLAGIFLYAGWVKVSDPALFAIQVRNYELLSDPWVALVAISLPWMEIFCALGLVTRRLERGALMWIIGMLAVFLFALISAMVRGLNIDCGCFTEALDRSSLAVAMATDVVLLVIAVRLLGQLKIKNSDENRVAG